jgi:hypothetical protein
LGGVLYDVRTAHATSFEMVLFIAAPDEFSVSVDGFDAVQWDVVGDALFVDDLEGEVVFFVEVYFAEGDQDDFFIDSVVVADDEVGVGVFFVPADSA